MKKNYRNNQPLRKALDETGVKYWELYEAAGISESVFYKMLRHELAADEQKELISIVNRLADAKKEAANV